MTNEALYFATTGEYSILGEALKANTSLLVLDLSENTPFNDSLEYHSEITDCLVQSASSRLRKLYVTSDSVDVMSHYLELIDQKPKLIVFNRGKQLEDVDVLEDS